MQQWMCGVLLEPFSWQLQWIEMTGQLQSGPVQGLARGQTAKFIPSEGDAGSKKLDVQALQVILHGFDKDRSGYIDWPEFRDMSKYLVDLLGEDGNWDEDVAREQFDACDASGDGMIEESEWLAFAGDVLSVLQGSNL